MMGLIAFVDEYGEAVEADLMKIGRSLDELGGALSYCSLLAFIRNAGPGSATYAATHPSLFEWGSGARQSAILADVYDLLSELRSNFASAHGVESTPSRYPRPWDAPQSDEPEETREQFDEWLKSKAVR